MLSKHPVARVGWRMLGLTIAIALTTSAAQAQDRSLSRYGGRVGFSIDPDQLTLGVYGGFPEFAPNVSFRPSGDLGFGDDLLTLIGNADVQYTFHDVRSRAVPFFGGGLGVLWFDPDPGESDAEIGINVYGGIEMPWEGYKTGILEVRLGIDDMPDIKVTYGFGFY